MPELPEVETVVRDLRPELVGRSIGRVRSGRKKLRFPWSPGWNQRLSGRHILDVQRRGKWIVIGLDNDDCLLVHLGMTGQFTVLQARAPLQDHTHLVFSLKPEDRELRFRDVRRFGSARLLSAHERSTFFQSIQLGPEPTALSGASFRASVSATRRCLKAVLLDQRVVAGVGNIYADESLFEARLHPALPGCRLEPRRIDVLRSAIGRVLKRAIDKRGSSIKDYVGGSGLKGSYQDEFRVYGRTGQPCPRCQTPIERIRLAGRSTHYCGKCQEEG